MSSELREWLTAGGTIVAAFAAAWAARAAKASTEVTSRLVNVEEERRADEQRANGTARLVARLQPTRWQSYRIIVENHGPDKARDVTMQIKTAKDGADELYPYMPSPTTSTTLLDLGQQLVITTPKHRRGIGVRVELRWNDSTGPRHVTQDLDDVPPVDEPSPVD